MACSSTCPTGDHESFGECIRAKGLKVAYCGVGGLDRTAQKNQDSELDFYRAARAQGVQPAGTRRPAVERALAISEKTGEAFQA